MRTGARRSVLQLALVFLVGQLALQNIRASQPKDDLGLQDALSHLGDGYRDGRPDAAAGAYTSLVGTSTEELRRFRDAAVLLERKAYGFMVMAPSGQEIERAEGLSLLEAAVVKTLMDFYQSFERSRIQGDEAWSVEMALHRAYRLTRTVAELQYEDMIRFVDVRLPGPNGRQSPIVSPTAILFYPNFRRDEELSAAQRAQLYQEKLSGFLGKGGDLSRIFDFNRESTERFGRYTRLEYVWLADGRIRATDSDAGHIILAEGQPVRGAGQIVLIKSARGEPSMLVISNASGNYKPDRSTSLTLAHRLAIEMQLPLTQVHTTSGEPLGPQAIKTYAKALGLPDARERVAKADERQRRWVGTGLVPPLCLGLVGGRSARYD